MLLCYESFDYYVIMIGDILIGLLDGLVWCVLARLSQQDHTQMVRKRAKAVREWGCLLILASQYCPKRYLIAALECFERSLLSLD